MSDHSPAPARFTWQQLIVLIVGAAYMLFGMLGFFFLDDATTALAGNDTRDLLLVFELNGLQNLVHLAIGVVGLICAAGQRAARRYGLLLAVVGLALFVFGAIAAGNTDINFLSLNWPDNILHGLTALLGLAVAFSPTRDVPVHQHSDSAEPRS